MNTLLGHLSRVRKDLAQRLSAFAPIFFSFYLLLLSLRIYEGFILYYEHPLTESRKAVSAFTMGSFFEIYFVSFLVLFLLSFFILLSIFRKYLAFCATLGLGNIMLLCETALIEYYTITLDPLGREFFEYEFSEIFHTIQASVNLTAGHFLPYVLVVVGFSGVAIGLSYYIPTKGKNLSSKIGFGVAVWIVFGILIGWGVFPEEEDFQGSAYYHLFSNKLILFADEVRGGTGTGALGEYQGPEYPLLRPADAPDVLSSHLKERTRPPNIVFVIVEGLGKAFVGPDAKWGGFAPYLDSLRHESLYWPNALSTSGSSFNAVPALFGSPPYDSQRYPTELVEEFGMRMPDHRSLISILEKNGYRTNFYTGSDASYNSVGTFLRYQDIGEIVDKGDFASKFQTKNAKHRRMWGHPDKAIVRQALSRMKVEATDRAESTRLDIVRTTSLHTPFDIPKEEQYLRKARRRIEQLDVRQERKEEYRRYEEVLAELLYADDAVRLLIESYADRPDYGRTLFVITGDHPTNSIPRNETVLSPFRVPLFLFSPMVEDPEVFPPLASHLQVTPTLLSHLTSQYDITQPDSVHWMGDLLDTSSTFKADVTMPLLRNKGTFGGYVNEGYLLNGDRAYTIHKDLSLEPAGSKVVDELKAELQAHRRMTRYIVREDKLMRSGNDAQISRLRHADLGK